MVIICEKVGSTKSIRVGRRYQVLSQTDNRYRIVNENNVEANYCKTLFREGRETGNERRAREGDNNVAQVAPEVVAAPVVPVVPVVNEINVETSAKLDENDDEEDAAINLKVKFIFINDINLTCDQAYTFSVTRSDIGCGIRDISGLNMFMTFTKTIKPKLIEFIALKARTNVFTVVEGFDIDGLIKDIYEALLQDIISKFQGDVNGIAKAGLINFSTNINNNDSADELVFEMFDEKADSSVEFVNPNGGNICKVWSFKTAE